MSVNPSFIFFSNNNQLTGGRQFMNTPNMGAVKFSKNFSDEDVFKSVWKDEVLSNFQLSEEEVDDILKDHYVNREVEVDNTAKGTTYTTDALNFLYTSYNEPFVLVENGVMFENQDKKVPPLVEGEMELFDTRREVKDLGNYYLTEGDNPRLGKLYNLRQSMIKIVMN